MVKVELRGGPYDGISVDVFPQSDWPGVVEFVIDTWDYLASKADRRLLYFHYDTNETFAQFVKMENPNLT